MTLRNPVTTLSHTHTSQQAGRLPRRPPAGEGSAALAGQPASAHRPLRRSQFRHAHLLPCAPKPHAYADIATNWPVTGWARRQGEQLKYAQPSCTGHDHSGPGPGRPARRVRDQQHDRHDRLEGYREEGARRHGDRRRGVGASPNFIFPLPPATNTDGYNVNLTEALWPNLVYDGDGAQVGGEPAGEPVQLADLVQRRRQDRHHRAEAVEVVGRRRRSPAGTSASSTTC